MELYCLYCYEKKKKIEKITKLKININSNNFFKNKNYECYKINILFNFITSNYFCNKKEKNKISNITLMKKINGKYSRVNKKEIINFLHIVK
jgi:hypothetical protein